MKKFISIFLLIVMIGVLSACTNNKDTPKILDKEGIAPYELTERDAYLLQSFGMENNSQIIAFNAPKEAITLRVNVCRLKDDSQWENIGDGAISIGTERIPTELLTGTFAMLLKENYGVDFHINCNGIVSYKSNEIDFDKEYIVSSKVFLTEFQEIQLNKEIPVALMVYDNDSSMRAYSLQDYFEPSKFEGMDLVQVVILTFTDNEL